MAYIKKTKFVPAVSLKRRDNLVASDFTNVPKFIPSYQTKSEKPNMSSLISMEYQQTWTKEKNEYLKSQSARNNEKKENNLMTKTKVNQQRAVRLKVTEKPPAKKITKYDHIQSRYKGSLHV
jgi:FKBP-type peptidyl-prolyl cis-trans isomerase